LDSVSDTFGVETIPLSIADEQLVGSYCSLSNRGGVVPEKITSEQLEEISGQIGIELIRANVNNGSSVLGSGICVNDKILLCGNESTPNEISQLTRIFKIENKIPFEQFNWNLI
jgi:translation initiation factor 6